MGWKGWEIQYTMRQTQSNWPDSTAKFWWCCISSHRFKWCVKFLMETISQSVQSEILSSWWRSFRLQIKSIIKLESIAHIETTFKISFSVLKIVFTLWFHKIDDKSKQNFKVLLINGLQCVPWQAMLHCSYFLLRQVSVVQGLKWF